MAYIYGSKLYPSISLLSYLIIEYSSTMAAVEPQFNSYLPYPQGWNGPSHDHMATFSHAATQLGPSTSQINPLHQPHLFFPQTPWHPTQFPIQSTLHPNHNKAV